MADGSARELSLADLHSRFDQLRAVGGHHVDPVRTRLIEGLLRRASNQTAGVQAGVMAKVSRLIPDLQQRVDAASQQAQTDLAKIESQRSDVLDEAQQLFEAGDYRALRSLARRTAQHHAGESPLATLTAELTAPQPRPAQDDRGMDFDDYLQQQDVELVAQLSSANGDDGSTNEDSASEPWAPLRSSRQFRQLRETQSVEQLLQQALQSLPEDPGPLNPQMLAIKSLSHMQNLSPQYLKRFLTYIDSLFWIDQAQRRLDAAKPKKKRRKKSG